MLKRQALTDNTVEAWQRFAAALERSTAHVEAEATPVKTWLVHQWHDNRVENTYLVFAPSTPSVEQVLEVVDTDYAQRWRDAKQYHPEEPFRAFHTMDWQNPAGPLDDDAEYFARHFGISLEGPFDIRESLPVTDGIPWREDDSSGSWTFYPCDLAG